MSGRFVSRLGVIAILGGLLGVGAASASAQCLANEIAKLTASDATPFDHLGTSVAILDELAIIGANRAEGMEELAGAVYVYRYDATTRQWDEQQKLIAEDGQWQDELGISVALNPLNPNVIIAGVWRDDDACPDDIACESGSAYVFRYDPDSQRWAQEQKLTASDGTFGDNFGRSVSIWGDVAVIGARLDDDPVQGSGSAYVFGYDADLGVWIEQQKLFPPKSGRFGTSVSLQGDVVVIGAPGDDTQGFNAGAAYIFRFEPQTQLWVQEQALLPTDPTEGAAFGWTVSLDGDTALIGAYSADTERVFRPGAAYVFRFDGKQWIQQQKLTASDGNTSDRFGWSVSLHGDMALIGAQLDDDYANGSGSSYIFTFDGAEWSETAKLRYKAVQGVHAFGVSVATDGEHVIVGANFTTVDGDAEAGAAYIYGGLGDCNENGELDLCDIADGFSPDDNNNGIPDECEIPGDLDGDREVGVHDLLILLGNWGPCDDCNDCLADIDGDCTVGVKDLLILLGNWG